MEITQQKVQRVSRVMKIITLVFCVEMIVQILLCIFIMVVQASRMDGIFQLFGGKLQITGNVLFGGTALFADNALLNSILSGYLTPIGVAKACAELTLCCFSLAILFRFYALFVAASADGHAFSIPNAKRLRGIGVTILVASIVVPAVETSVLVATTGNKTNLSIGSLPVTLLAISFFFFSMLFYYGAQLQQQADETL